MAVRACVRARRRRRLRAPVQSGGFGGHSWAEALQSDGATGGRMRSGRRRGFRTAKLSQPAPTFRPLLVAIMGALIHPLSVVFGDGRNALGANLVLCCCAMLLGAAIRRLSGTRRLFCVGVRLFVCLCARHMQHPASLLLHKLAALRLTSRACNASCAAASCARLSRRLLTSRPFRPFAGLPTWTSFRSSASAFSPQARRRRRRRSAAHATPSAVAYRTPASLRCARLRVIRRGGAGITTQSLPATFGSFHVTDVLALSPQPMRMRRGRRTAQALPFALHGARTAPEGNAGAAAPRALHLAV
jgi:hypothetical protein